MKVGWLQDDHGYIGGAEMTAQAFRDAAPEDVEIIDCPPQGVVTGLDRYVINNCFQYEPDELRVGAPAFKYCHDVMPHISLEAKAALAETATLIFCSQAQRERMGLQGEVIPPAGDYRKLPPNPDREGTCTIAQWRNLGKGGVAIEEWAAANGPVDSYGPGPFHPHGRFVNYRGELESGQVRHVLHRYERFVFLPDEFEPFCRTVAEAYVAGCQLVSNRLVGALEYLPDFIPEMERSADTFWGLVCASE